MKSFTITQALALAHRKGESAHPRMHAHTHTHTCACAYAHVHTHTHLYVASDAAKGWAKEAAEVVHTRYKTRHVHAHD